jgi:hypothetical protein
LQNHFIKYKCLFPELKEVDDVSEKPKLILQKIRLSANKMQTLLIDLVNILETIKGDKIYVDVDLERLFIAIDELSSNIEDKNARIELGTLQNESNFFSVRSIVY